MVRLRQDSIAQDAIDINLAKVGYTAFYVDGTDGLDTYPGDSWDQPFKTVQHAIDEGEDWCTIYIASGTYAEALTIATTKTGISLIGADMDTTIIDATGIAAHTLNLLGTKCLVEHIHFRHDSATYNCINAVTHHAWNKVIRFCSFRNMSGGCIYPGVGSTIEDCEFMNFTKGIVINASVAYGSIDFGDCIIRRNLLVSGAGSGDYGISDTGGLTEIYDNNIVDCVLGVWGGRNDITIYHNNFFGNTTPITFGGVLTRYKLDENYYSNHTNIDTNHDGLCDAAYTFATGVDYHPVPTPNGWQQESLGATTTGDITIEGIYDLVNAGLTLTETGGTITTDGTEQNVYINNAPFGVFDPKVVKMDFTNHTATETVILREYYRLKSGGGLVKVDERSFTGVQNPLIKNIMLEPTRFGVQVTIEKTVGTNRAYDFEAVYKI